MRAAFLLIGLLSLSACARPVPVSPAVPAELLTCADDPTPPSGEYTQADVASFILDQAEALDDCRGKLVAVRQVLQPRAD